MTTTTYDMEIGDDVVVAHDVYDVHGNLVLFEESVYTVLDLDDNNSLVTLEEIPNSSFPAQVFFTSIDYEVSDIDVDEDASACFVDDLLGDFDDVSDEEPTDEDLNETEVTDTLLLDIIAELKDAVDSGDLVCPISMLRDFFGIEVTTHLTYTFSDEDEGLFDEV